MREPTHLRNLRRKAHVEPEAREEERVLAGESNQPAPAATSSCSVIFTSVVVDINVSIGEVEEYDIGLPC